MFSDFLRAVDVFDLESYLIRNNIDYLSPSGNSEEYRINCFAPLGCNGSDNKHHLYVNTDAKKWYCFKCGYGNPKLHPRSNLLSRFIADLQKIPHYQAQDFISGQTRLTPQEELTLLIEKAFENAQPKPRQLSTIAQPIDLPSYFLKFSDQTRFSMQKNYKQYLLNRGLEERDLEKYDIRYCFSPSDRLWKSRIIFPIYNTLGKVCSAIGRAVHNLTQRYQNWPKSDIKKLIWPLGEFSKGEFKPVEAQKKTVVLVEGIFDSLAINKLTDFQAFCTLGKKLSDNQIFLLQNLGAKRVVLAWDKEAKTQIFGQLKRLQSSFSQVTIFPFQNEIWNTLDFGDMLRPENKSYQFLLQKELENSVSSVSADLIQWRFN